VRSKLWKAGVKIGTEDGIGGFVPVYAGWLVRTLLKQKHVVNRDGVSEHDLLKRLFWLTVQVHRKYTKGHRTWVSRKEYLLLRREGRTGDSITVADGLKNLFSGFIEVSDSCVNKGYRAAANLVPDIELTNLPEIIMIGTPKWADTTQNKMDFTFQVPAVRNLELNSVTQAAPDNDYRLRSASLTMDRSTKEKTRSHAVSFVEAGDGQSYHVDNDNAPVPVKVLTQRIDKYINKMQAETVSPSVRILPVMFFFVKQQSDPASDTAARPARRSSKWSSKRKSPRESEEVAS
jgi:hypothetical protein